MIFDFIIENLYPLIRQKMDRKATGELAYSGLIETRKIGPSYAKSVI